MSNVTGLVAEIQRFSVHDGPGIRSTVFLKGCPLSCQWCHNPELIKPGTEVFLNRLLCFRCFDCLDVCTTMALTRYCDEIRLDKSKCTACGDCVNKCPSGALALTGRKMSTADVVKIIQRDREFYNVSGGGVTISGGEPMMQPDFVAVLARELKADGITVALDTCGYASLTDYLSVLEYTDIVLFDLKSMENNKHIEYTGKSNNLIKENYARLAGCNVRIFVRVPLIPGFNDDIQNIQELSDFISEYRKPEEIDLLSFNLLSRSKYKNLAIEYRFNNNQNTSHGRLEEIKTLLTNRGFKVVLYS